MTNTGKLKIVFGIISTSLLIMLLIKLKTVPGGMILSGLALGIIFIGGIIFGCVMLSSMISMIFKQLSFTITFFITTAISFLVFHYQLYSPVLNIKVPNGYHGEINLVLSNLKENRLDINQYGIGYLNESTFNKTYLRPVVKQIDGKNLDQNLVGFNPSTFFGKSAGDGNSIRSLSFKITPDKETPKNDDIFIWMDKVDSKLILLKDPNLGISNKSITIGFND